MNNRSHKQEMFRWSLSRSVGWLGLISLFSCGLLYPTAAQNNNRAQKEPPRKPVETQTSTVNTKPTAGQFVPGELKGKLNYYDDEQPGSQNYGRPGTTDHLRKRGCFDVGDTGQDINGSNSAGFGQTPSESWSVAKTRVVLVGFKIKGPKGNEGDVAIAAGCDYDFKDVPPGTYKLRAYMDLSDYSWNGWTGAPSSSRLYAGMLSSFISVPLYKCASNKDPKCVANPDKEVTIKPGQVTTLDVSLKIYPVQPH